MNKKKVLIITYYWPPAGGPGVQRWLKFTKYLPEFNIEPIVFIPENPSYPIVDESLKSEVSADLNLIQTKIWEPYQIAERLNPKSKAYKAGHFEKSENQSFLTKLSVFIRDRKSTRLNSSHVAISYAVFSLKKKKQKI